MQSKFAMVSLDDFCSLQRKLLLEEYNAEQAESSALLAEESRLEIAERGSAILNIRFDSVAPSLFGRSVLLFRHRLFHSKRHESACVFQQNSLTSGDIVGVFQGSFVGTPLLKGVIHSIDSKSIRIIPDSDFDEVRFDEDSLFDIAKIGSKVTHDRLMKSVVSLEKSHHSLVHYMFEDDSSAPIAGSLRLLTNVSEPLNIPQKHAVQNAISNPLITLVHGPAGTGKTTTLASIIAESIRADPSIKILACAPSNVAVDNLAARVLSLGIAGIVRVGHPVRVDTNLLDHSLDSLVRKSDFYDSCKDIESELTSHLCSSRPPWSEIRILRKELKERQNKSIQNVFSKCNVVFATCNGSFGLTERFFSVDPNFVFDMCVIDECAQGLEMSCWIPVLQARRVVLGGDHKQLPATVKSPIAEQQGLGTSLFERVHARFADSDNIVNLLTVQYRMNEIIMGWSNREFYDNKLVAHESNKTWTLQPTCAAMLDDVIDLTDIVKSPFVFIDTAGVDGMNEQANSTSASKYNLGEVLVVMKYLELVTRVTTPSNSEVSIISPYLMQTEKLRETIANDRVEIATVDSFQGRENDLIIISLVRSNPSQTVGFLSDYRRLNVAVTRARRQVLIVGDSETISSDIVLKSLFDYANEFGTVISAQSFIKDSDVHALIPPEKVNIVKSADSRKQPDRKRVEPRAPEIRKSAPVAETNDDERAKFSSTIERLSDSEKFFFPCTLSGASRKIIHAICEQAGYSHGSVGEGSSRQIWVQKVKPSRVESPERIPQPVEIPKHSVSAPKITPPIPKPKKVNHPSIPSTSAASNKIAQPTTTKPAGVCPYATCQMGIKLVSLDCRHCELSFCIAHATPECHGCGDAAKREARAEAKSELRKMQNPSKILPQGKGGVSTEQLRKKMDSKLKSMESNRGKQKQTK